MNYKLKKDVKAFTSMVPMVLTVVIAFAILFVGLFVNGSISSNLRESMKMDDYNSSTGHIVNSSYRRLNNLSADQDSALDIVQVVIIITILAAAIGAIFLFTRFR